MELYQEVASLASTLKIPDTELREWIETRVKEEREERRIKEEKEERRIKEEKEERRIKEEKEERRIKEEREDQIRNEEREERRLRREYDLEKLRLENEIANSQQPQQAQPHAPRLPKINPFDERKDDLENYLIKFEAILSSHHYPPNMWIYELLNVLSGEALHTITAIPEAERKYEYSKNILLQKFRFTEQGYRDRFRNLKPLKNEDFGTFANRANTILERWLSMAKVESQNFGQIYYLFLSTQILQSCKPELAAFIRERKPANLKQLKELGLQYEAAHPTSQLDISVPCYAGFAKTQDSSHWNNGSKFPDRQVNNRGRDFQRRSDQSHNYRGQRSLSRNHRQQSTDRRTPFKDRPDESQNNKQNSTADKKITCQLCGKLFHSALQCRQFNVQKKHHANLAVAAPAAETPNPADQTSSNNLPTHHANSGITGQGIGSLHLVEGRVNATPASILRDTGCTTAIVKKSFVEKHQYTGESCNLLDIANHPRICQMARIYVESPYFDGWLLACVLEKPFADLIIGNIPEVLTREETQTIHNPPEIANAATTRAMAQRARQPDKPLRTKLPACKFDRDNWIKAQSDDASIQCLLQENSSHQRGNVKYIVYDDLICREHTKDNASFTQIVVPSSFRTQILAVSHDSITSGHLGVCSTYKRIVQKFYWPGLRKDIREYVQSCHICQIKSQKGRVPKVPLEKMPIIDKPFDTVAIDLVGPLHKSDRNHTHILTFIDYGTRWPEAVPLKSTTTEHVAEALFTICTRLGLPRNVISDNGSQFVSEVMNRTLHLMGVNHKFTTPFHPQANGLCERFHSTMKSMLKKVAHENPTDWDRMLPAVLFAYREIPQESTGYSPFELTFGRRPRGVLGVIHDNLRHIQHYEPEFVLAYDYVKDLSSRIESTCKIAQQNVKESAERYKKYADKGSKVRKFQKGDQVLVLIPKEKSKLLLTWKGPYQVKSVRSGVNYEIDIKNKRKVYHANLLKRYIPRKEDISSISNVEHAGAAIVIDEPQDEIVLPTLASTNATSEFGNDLQSIAFSNNVNDERKTELWQLLNEFITRLRVLDNSHSR